MCVVRRRTDGWNTADAATDERRRSMETTEVYYEISDVEAQRPFARFSRARRRWSRLAEPNGAMAVVGGPAVPNAVACARPVEQDQRS